jgi:hypothetical protein
MYDISDVLATFGTFTKVEISNALHGLKKRGELVIVGDAYPFNYRVGVIRPIEKSATVHKFTCTSNQLLEREQKIEIPEKLKPWAEVWPDFFNTTPIPRGRSFVLEM